MKRTYQFSIDWSLVWRLVSRETKYLSITVACYLIAAIGADLATAAYFTPVTWGFILGGISVAFRHER